MIRRPTQSNKVEWKITQKASLLEDNEDYAEAVEDLKACLQELTINYTAMENIVGILHVIE